MTTLLDVLLDAASGSIFDPGVPAIHNIVAAIPPDTREALEVGLLLAEVERRLPGGTHLVPNTVVGIGSWDAGYWTPPDSGVWTRYETGPTLHAALTALLEQLPVPEPVA